MIKFILELSRCLLATCWADWCKHESDHPAW